MNHLLPTNTELLVELAAQADVDYLDAYYVWAEVNEQEDAYSIVETVLYVAKMHRLPVCLALIACQLKPNRYQEYKLTAWVTA